MPGSRARCSLFGPVDSEKLQKDLRQELEKLSDESQQRWNFDFKTDSPMKGHIEWKSVSADVDDVPVFYHTSQYRKRHYLDELGSETPSCKCVKTDSFCSCDKLISTSLENPDLVSGYRPTVEDLYLDSRPSNGNQLLGASNRTHTTYVCHDCTGNYSSSGSLQNSSFNPKDSKQKTSTNCLLQNLSSTDNDLIVWPVQQEGLENLAAIITDSNEYSTTNDAKETLLHP